MRFSGAVVLSVGAAMTTTRLIALLLLVFLASCARPIGMHNGEPVYIKSITIMPSCDAKVRPGCVKQWM